MIPLWLDGIDLPSLSTSTTSLLRLPPSPLFSLHLYNGYYHQRRLCDHCLAQPSPRISKHRLLMDLKENCRPPNSWIIYRKEASRGLPTEDSQNIGPISTFISYHWRSKLSKETKEEWGQLAHWLQTMHKQWFPSYKFSPKTKEQKAEIKHERKLQTKSVKALGPVSVGTSSRPQPYTNRPSTRTKRHCPSQSSASSLDSIITPPMPFIQVAGLSAPAPVSFPLMGQDQFASNTNDFTSYGFRTPLNESYNFMHSMGAATNPAIPVPNPQPVSRAKFTGKISC